MSLFWIFFVGGGEGLGSWFCGVFEGCLGKEGVWVWCFDGEFVVERVVEMDRKQ
jgi:hypothetical protein